METLLAPYEVCAGDDRPGVAPGRALTSATEFTARLAGAGAHVVTAHWGTLHFVSVELGGTGSIEVTLPGFFSVARFSTGASKLGSTVGIETALRNEHSGLVLVHGLRQRFDYCWYVPHRLYWVCLEPRVVLAAAREFGLGEELPPITLRAAAEDRICSNLLGVLTEEAAIGPHLAQQLIVDSVANALAARLLQRFATSVRAVCPRGALTMRAFRDVCAHIDRNLGARLSLGDLAAVAGVSRFHFARQFRLRTGETPMGYVLRRRVERAQDLLRDRGRRVSDVAAFLGFADQSHFTRTFKRFVGVSPSRFSVHARSEANGRAADMTPRVGSR